MSGRGARSESFALGPAQLGEALRDLATVRERAAKRREGPGEPLRGLPVAAVLDQGELGQCARDGALELVCDESQDLDVVRESLLGALPALLEGRCLGVDLVAHVVERDRERADLLGVPVRDVDMLAFPPGQGRGGRRQASQGPRETPPRDPPFDGHREHEREDREGEEQHAALPLGDVRGLVQTGVEHPDHDTVRVVDGPVGADPPAVDDVGPVVPVPAFSEDPAGHVGGRAGAHGSPPVRERHVGGDPDVALEEGDRGRALGGGVRSEHDVANQVGQPVRVPEGHRRGPEVATGGAAHDDHREPVRKQGEPLGPTLRPGLAEERGDRADRLGLPGRQLPPPDLRRDRTFEVEAGELVRQHALSDPHGILDAGDGFALYRGDHLPVSHETDEPTHRPGEKDAVQAPADSRAFRETSESSSVWAVGSRV